MKFRYRVKGLVRKPFILRSAYFGIGDNMEFYLLDDELDFVQRRCDIDELIDFEEKVETPKPVLEESKIEAKGVENGSDSKRNNKTIKNKNKSKL